MADYRLIMKLLIQEHSYRVIESMARCSHTVIARARRVLEEEHFTSVAQVEGLSATDLDRLFTDGRKAVVGEFVPIDYERVVVARLGRKKPPLKVLWAQYIDHANPPTGKRLYGYDRFCELVADHVRVNDLTAPINHIPGHTMQVDWAGTRMQIVDPVTRTVTPVSVFVASLPYSGLVFAYPYLNERQPSWFDGHRRAFEYVGGVPLVVVPDNPSTASNQIMKGDRARDVNAVYADFLEHYGTAAAPARANHPRDKGNVEAGVKAVTNWVIHYLADRMFASLDDLTEAVAQRVEWINQREPFRGEKRSRRAWFIELEREELIELPKQRWEEVVWRKAKVHRDWHVQLDTVKYSVPYEFVGLSVDVRIVGDMVDVIANGEVIATHQRSVTRGSYVTVSEHAPKFLHDATGFWTRAFFVRQAAKSGPATVTVIERLLDSKKIEAQGYRSCQNILDLGKRGNRLWLEEACRLLLEDHGTRSISYTAVKHQLALVKSHNDARPRVHHRTSQGGSPMVAPAVSRVRDTSRAYLAGASAFSLDQLTGAKD